MGQFTSTQILKCHAHESLSRTQFHDLMVQNPDRIASSATTIRKIAVLLLCAGLTLMVPLLALAFGSLVLDPFPPSAPPM
jgi:hypothetical protein